MPRRRNQTDESEDYEDSEEEEKIQIRKPKIQRIDKFKHMKKIIINVSMTQYPVVSEVAEQLGWKIQTSNDAGDWDIYWTDFSIDPDILIRMHLFQKINHFPGIQTLARKNLLAANLNNMGRVYANQYSFYPQTWMLPQQYAQFRQYYESKPKGKTRTYIVKPEADCQGRGIFLTRKIQDMETGKHYVVQRYLARPYLLEGLKFDLRIYVLLASTNPLKIYIFNEGLARLATQLYNEPLNTNLDKLCMHLTNYAINKHNPKFIFNNNSSNMGIGHKRSLGCAYKQLQKSGLDLASLKEKIKDVIIKTVISGLPLMSHQYRCSQPEDYTGNMCFHILGFDVMLNNKGQPFVLEVNHTPSFTTDTPLDHKIKFNLIKDTLILMNINVKQKNQLYNRSKQINTERLLTGKRQIFEGEDREAKIKEAQEIRQKYESKHLGGYEKIYPLNNPEKMEKYQAMINASMALYMEENQSIKNRMQEKELKKLMKMDLKNRNKNSQNNPDELKEPQSPMKTPSAPSHMDTMSLLDNDDFRDDKRQINAMPASSPLIDTKFSPEPRKKYVQKTEHLQSGLLSDVNIAKVNQIRSGIRQKYERINSLLPANQKDGEIKSPTVIKQAPRNLKSTGSKFQNYEKTTKISDYRKSERNQPIPKQFPNIQNTSSISEHFRTSQCSQKRQERPVHNGVLKSAPKQIKLIDTFEKDIKEQSEKKTVVSNNGNYVMPKIFYLNIQAQRGERKDQLNFLTMGRKIQNVNFQQE